MEQINGDTKILEIKEHTVPDCGIAKTSMTLTV